MKTEWETKRDLKLKEGIDCCKIEPSNEMGLIAEINKLKNNKSAGKN